VVPSSIGQIPALLEPLDADYAPRSGGLRCRRLSGHGEFELPEGWDRPYSADEADAFRGGEAIVPLDTSPLPWSLADPDRLSAEAREGTAMGLATLGVVALAAEDVY
jgi:hypothetical protein